MKKIKTKMHNSAKNKRNGLDKNNIEHIQK